jgi:hypothetical protein
MDLFISWMMRLEKPPFSSFLNFCCDLIIVTAKRKKVAFKITAFLATA